MTQQAGARRHPSREPRARPCVNMVAQTEWRKDSHRVLSYDLTNITCVPRFMPWSFGPFGIVYAWGSTFFCMVGTTLLFWAVFSAAAIALKIIETTAHRASAEERKERLLLGGEMGDRFFAWWDGYYLHRVFEGDM